MNISEILLIEDIRRRNPGRLHPADMQLLLEIRKMVQQTSTSVAALATAVTRICADVAAVTKDVAAALAAHPATEEDDSGELAGFVDQLNTASTVLEGLGKQAAATGDTAGDQGGDQSGDTAGDQGGTTTAQSTAGATDQPGPVSGGSGLQPQS